MDMGDPKKNCAFSALRKSEFLRVQKLSLQKRNLTVQLKNMAILSAGHNT